MRDIPLKLKMRLMEFAKRLPESSRARFLIETSRKIAAFAFDFIGDHKYSVVYGTIGFALGRILDELLVFTLPVLGELRLTLGLASVLLGTSGLAYGFLRDYDLVRFRDIIIRQVRKALQ